MILPIYIYGQPVLRKQTNPVTQDYEGLGELIQNMYETLTNSEGVGLAAPQVGLPLRMAVIDLTGLADEEPQYEGFQKAYLNPRILETDDTEMETMEEGCLSLPGIHENVKRPGRILVEWDDEAFQHHKEWITGFLARVMQHEFDHLDGKMFIDRLSPMRKQLIKSKLRALLQGRYQCSYRTKGVRR